MVFYCASVYDKTKRGYKLKKPDDDTFLDSILEYVVAAGFKELTDAEVQREVMCRIDEYQAKGLKYSELLDNFKRRLGMQTTSIGVGSVFSSIPLDMYAVHASRARADRADW